MRSRLTTLVVSCLALASVLSLLAVTMPTAPAESAPIICTVSGTNPGGQTVTVTVTLMRTGTLGQTIIGQFVSNLENAGWTDVSAFCGVPG